MNIIGTLHAGLPYTLLVSDAKSDMTLYAQVDGRLERIHYIGRDGCFDSYPFHVFKWVSGKHAGETERSYSVMFWRKPNKAEKRTIWNDLTEYEQQKLLRGEYPGLHAGDYFQGDAR